MLFSRSTSGSSLFRDAFRRNFSSGGSGGNSGFDRLVNLLIRRLPQGNIGWLIIGLNSLFYFLYLTWPRHQMYSYLNNFTFSKFNLMNGRLHTFLTCHFTHMSFLTYVLDSVILYLFCNNLMQMFGPLFLGKTVLMSMFIASFFLFLQNASSAGAYRPYYGNDAIMRGLIFTVIFQNPSASFYLLPLPIQIPAWGIAAVLLGLDFLSFNVSGFGGVTASYLMINYFL
jgi:membrane associated rhomboid family serine protease